MKMLVFARRNAREILRDPLTAIFSLGFPVVILALLTAIQANVPVDLFRLETLTPGVTIFGLAVMTLFSATLIARDRETALLQRLYTTPLTAADFIFGYLLPVVPIALAQCIVCYGFAMLLGLKPTVTMIGAVLTVLPAAFFFIGLGLLCGSIMNTKQVGGLCGALLTNLTAWLSGTWFVAYALPFVHAVEMERAVLAGNWSGVFPHLWWVLGYMALTLAAAVLLFLRQMRRQ